ncbi:hypothetical protein LIER_24290 [Lithospermum erythrorhizon]|uniref:Uncharacterized protein n=1 Tax=Lithospermum erythrorhizon TaxID=34254 RepID=A0AAV3R4A2_LITER
MSEAADMIDPHANPYVDDTTDVEVSNKEGSDANINPSVEDTLNGLKDSTPLWGAVMRPFVDDSIKNTGADNMDVDIPSVADIEPVTAEAIKNMTPSVTNTGAETVGQDGIDTVDADVKDVIHEKAIRETMKFKKRRLRKLVDSAETYKPKKKLSKEERASNRARKAERRARKVAEAKTTEDNDVEEVVPEETEEAIPPVDQPSVDDEWLPEHEPQGDNEDDQADESGKEDVAAVVEKRRKAKGKLRMNENRTRVGNRKIPKNVAFVPTTNVSLNSEEEQTR